ncbi:MAG: flavin reductase family protein [Pseudomonadota bacterium]
MTEHDPSLAPVAAFKAGMARVPGAVHIVTTDGPAGRAGLTATAVSSVTTDPPTLLVCVNETSSVGQAFISNEAVAINTVGPDFTSLAMLFGGKTPMEERFEASDWAVGASGAPRLLGASASFDTRVVGGQTVGSHRVLFCEVMDVTLGDDAAPCVYHDRAFKVLTSL